MTQINLPALWFDRFQEEVADGLYLANQIPEAGDVDVDTDSDVVFDLLSTVAAPVDLSNTQVYLESLLAYDGSAGGFQTGYQGPNSIVEYLAAVGATEELADGDMEFKGTQELADGDMEFKGSQVVVDGDMEAGLGADLIADGDMELTTQGDPLQDGDMEYLGSQVIVDGDMEDTGAEELADGDMESGEGTEELADGDMEEAGTTAWSETNSPLATKVSGSPGGSGSLALNVAYTSVANPLVYQDVLTAGQVYQVTGWARGDGTAIPRLIAGAIVVWTGTSSATWQAIDITFVSVGTGLLKLQAQVAVAGAAEFDDISAIDICPDWASVNDGVLTKSTASPHGGSQALRVTYNATSNPIAVQTILTSSIRYLLHGWARSDGTAIPRVKSGDSSIIWTGIASTSWQEFIVIATTTSTRFDLQCLTAIAGWAEFDDVSVTAEDVTAWTVGSSAILTKVPGDPGGGGGLLASNVEVNTGESEGRASQIVVATGVTYRLTGWARGDGTAYPDIRSSIAAWTGTSSATWQAIDVSFVAGNTSVVLRTNGVAGTSCEFDGIVVTSDVPDWFATNDALLSKETATPHGGALSLRVTYNGTANPAARQTVFAVGDTYRIHGWARGDGTAYPRIYAGGAWVWTGTTSTSWQEFEVSAAATATNVFFYGIAVASGYCDFDDITISDECRDWDVVNAPLLTKESGAPGGGGAQVLRIAYGGTVNPSAQQDVLTIGKCYRITGWVRGDGTFTPRFRTSITILWTGTTSTSWQAVDFVFYADDTELYCQCAASSAGWSEFDDIVAKEEASDWTSANSALLSKEAGLPGGTGSQVLRVAYTSASNPQAQQGVLTSGKTYRATGWARGDGGTLIPRVYFGGATLAWSGTTSASWQAFDVSAVAAGVGLLLFGLGSAGHVEFDDILVTEDCPDWTEGSSAIMSKEAGAPGGSGSQVMRVSWGASTWGAAQQDLPATGKTYRVTGWARGDGTNYPRIYGNGGGTNLWNGTTSTSWQAFDESFYCTAVSLWLFGNMTSGYVEFDDIVVTEDCPDWTPENSAVMSKQTGTPYAGLQVLRVEYDGSGSPTARQTTLTSTVEYQVTGWVRGDGTSIPWVQLGSITVFTGTTSTAWQEVNVVGTANGAYFRLGLTGSGYVEWDDMSALESSGDVRFTIDPETDFASEAVVTARVVSEVVGGAYTIDESYSFTIEDIIDPKLLSVLATYATTLRATFDEGMLASSNEGAADATNPANYTILYVPENDRQAAVSVAVTSVTQVSEDVYDLTTDIELSFWRNYSLTCGSIADDSSNANPLDADFRTAGFASWTPPEWPTTRRFRIWDMLAQQNRDDDVTGDLERLVDCWQDVVWMLLWDADRMEQIWDIDRAPEVFIDARLQDLGNPHSFDLTENQKKKLLDVLVPSYKQHGTEPAIINLVRFFLGITVTILAYNSFEYRWVLGEDTLGQGTYLGPGDGDPALYTFVIQSLTELTTEQRRWIGQIAEATKVAHEHYVIQDPNDAVTFDHWELGYSRLGLETILH